MPVDIGHTGEETVFLAGLGLQVKMTGQGADAALTRVVESQIALHPVVGGDGDIDQRADAALRIPLFILFDAERQVRPRDAEAALRVHGSRGQHGDTD